MNKKVLLMAAAAALIVIAAPRPAAKAMTAIPPALEEDNTQVIQIGGRGGRGGGFRGSGGSGIVDRLSGREALPGRHKPA